MLEKRSPREVDWSRFAIRPVPKWMESVKTGLDSNDLLLEDYREVVYPIQCLDGIAIWLGPGGSTALCVS
jgi:hypothetical protein